jgi:carboxypeptidase family protein
MGLEKVLLELMDDSPRACEPPREAREEGVAVSLTGGIVGSVTDAQGRTVSARVLVIDKNRGRVREGVPVSHGSDFAAGWFQLCGLRAGEYSLTIEAPGFDPVVLPRVRVEPFGVTAVGTVRLNRVPDLTAPRFRRARHVPPFLPLPWRRLLAG